MAQPAHTDTRAPKRSRKSFPLAPQSMQYKSLRIELKARSLRPLFYFVDKLICNSLLLISEHVYIQYIYMYLNFYVHSAHTASPAQL